MTDTVDLKERFEAEALQYLDAVYRTALYLSRNEKDAEDLTQEAFLKAFQKFHQFTPGTNLRAWLTRIMVNTFLNTRRRKSSANVSFENVSEFTEGGVEPDFEYLALADEERFKDQLDAEVRRSLENLPEDYRVVLLLVALEGFSYQEVADTLGIPIGTVMSRLYRARKTMQDDLEDYAREMRVG